MTSMMTLFDTDIVLTGHPTGTRGRKPKGPEAEIRVKIILTFPRLMMIIEKGGSETVLNRTGGLSSFVSCSATKMWGDDQYGATLRATMLLFENESKAFYF